MRFYLRTWLQFKAALTNFHHQFKSRLLSKVPSHMESGAVRSKSDPLPIDVSESHCLLDDHGESERKGKLYCWFTFKIDDCLNAKTDFKPQIIPDGWEFIMYKPEDWGYLRHVIPGRTLSIKSDRSLERSCVSEFGENPGATDLSMSAIPSAPYGEANVVYRYWRTAPRFIIFGGTVRLCQSICVNPKSTRPYMCILRFLPACSRWRSSEAMTSMDGSYFPVFLTKSRCLFDSNNW